MTRTIVEQKIKQLPDYYITLVNDYVDDLLKKTKKSVLREQGAFSCLEKERMKKGRRRRAEEKGKGEGQDAKEKRVQSLLRGILLAKGVDARLWWVLAHQAGWPLSRQNVHWLGGNWVKDSARIWPARGWDFGPGLGR